MEKLTDKQKREIKELEDQVAREIAPKDPPFPASPETWEKVKNEHSQENSE